MKRNTFSSIFLVIIGAFIFSIAINMFSIPNNLGEGGITGVSLMLYYITGIPMSLSSIVLNSIILLIGWRYLEKRTMVFTLLATVLTSFFLQFTSGWGIPMENVILAPLCSGLLVGLSLGIVMQAGGSTAGTDIIALILNKYFGWSTSVALLVLDVLVVAPSIVIIGLENVVLTIVHLYIQTRVLTFVLEGFNPRKQVFIISDKYQEISREIDRVLGRGMTFFHAEGYFRGNDTKVILVVINRQQIMPLKKIVNSLDPRAFVVISDVQTVAGEGFTYMLSDEEMRHKVDEFVRTGTNTMTDYDGNGIPEHEALEPANQAEPRK